VEISIEQVAVIQPGMALGITRSDPGDNLDLTRDTPIWAVVEWADPSQVESIDLVGGEGIGKQSNLDDRAAIYSYAQQLIKANLDRLLLPGQKIRVTIVLPEGRALATRTSNAAFGVVEGCLGELRLKSQQSATHPQSLLGGECETSAIEVGDLQGGEDETIPSLVFCIGENGLDLAQQMGIKRDRIIKTANWLGPLLAEAGVLGVPKLLLFGYHGKLIKLAAGIFHTHHHLADGRLETLVTAAARMGLAAERLTGLFDCETAEDVLKYLRSIDLAEGTNWVERIYGDLTDRIDARSQAYIYSQTQRQVNVGSVLFDRQRQVIGTSPTGATFLTELC
jgi:cobalt-precorrin-5B (C1)-methyltransferase